MSAQGRFWLGLSGAETEFNPDGITVTTEDKEIAREDRVANGDLVIDVIAVKKVFSLKLDALMGQDLMETMLALYTSGVSEVLSFILENENASTTTYSVKFRPFTRTTLLKKDRWLWEGVTFTLEEV